MTDKDRKYFQDQIEISNKKAKTAEENTLKETKRRKSKERRMKIVGLSIITLSLLIDPICNFAQWNYYQGYGMGSALLGIFGLVIFIMGW